MIEVLDVGASRAAEVVAVIHASFGDRPPLDPPATAMAETEESVSAELAEYGGLLVLHESRPVGTLMFTEHDGLLGLRRVGVLPEARRLGAASALADAAKEHARRLGLRGLELEARAELPATIAFWNQHGYVETDRNGPRLTLTNLLPLTYDSPRSEDTRSLGARLGRQLRKGDLIILSGELGAGKTTLAQGLGAGLGIRGPVTSPTFVISRVHPSEVEGPPLIHVDAFRLNGSVELDDLDLDTDIDQAVTIVEWGTGLAEGLATDRIDIRLERASDDSRRLTLTPVGRRWRDADLRSLLA